MKVVITAAAHADLQEISNYIGAHNPERAESFVDELLDQCESLADMPRRYPLVPRYEHLDVRRCVRGDYLIFYRILDEVVQVIHVLHGAMEYEALLFPKDS